MTVAYGTEGAVVHVRVHVSLRGMPDQGFRVEGLRFTVKGLGFRV